MINRIDQTFRRLRKEGKTALVPFFTAGDPDLATTAELMRVAVESGADLIEIGVPFSDPTADGPTLQKSIEVGLGQHASLARILEMIAEFRRESPVPIVLYGYFNPIFHYGCERFALDAKQSGVDGLLVVDLPPEESDELLRHTEPAQLHFVFLLAPTTGEARARRILKRAGGFVYYVSVTGVTGVKAIPLANVKEAVDGVRKLTRLPIGVGFGISTPEQAATVAEFADAAIVGSAIMRLVDSKRGSSSLVRDVGEYLRSLRVAIDGVPKEAS